MRQSIRIDILPVVFTVIILGCVFPVRAINITECGSNENGEYMNITRSDCNYTVIFCNGQNSQFCDAIDMCDPSYNCPEATDISVSTTIGTTFSTSNGSTFSTSVGSTVSTTPRSTTTGTPAEDIRAKCRRGITAKYKYPGNCNYYYYCLEGFLIVEQCPFGFVFSEETKACSRLTPDYQGCK
ncbi:uncharacterized protein LOC132789252 [Drosophila nasuta]|uniref:uncharacterized protein LOC132789252 n=1 Tax=Drosophila nasuta TaxID=42062 RepID=UPI00295E8090|nr:uncharacterized protein LOC132789252 [Drosophila nasuta]